MLFINFWARGYRGPGVREYVFRITGDMGVGGSGGVHHILWVRGVQDTGVSGHPNFYFLFNYRECGGVRYRVVPGNQNIICV